MSREADGSPLCPFRRPHGVSSRSPSRWLLLLAAAAGVWLPSDPPASAAPAPAPQALCRQLGTDDTLRPIPGSLVPAATRFFDLKAMPAVQIRRSTYFRCSEGQVLLCNVGANLPCGKANTSRDLPGAEAWCAGHANSDFIPMSVTGHDTIYHWRCLGAKAAIAGTPAKVDRRGFIADLWKRMNPER